MNILIAPNSFKECADSVTIADIIAEQLGNSTHYLFIRPMTDGGDGFLEVSEKIFDLSELNLKNIRSYADYLNFNKLKYSKKSKIVFLESAELFGLKSTPKSDRNPIKLNTAVLGKILLGLSLCVKENLLDIKSVWIGVGGTATIDFGIGACSQLGLKLFDDTGKLVKPIPANFYKVRSFDFTEINLPFKINFIVDVDTSLLGEPGAIEIYGQQKGASKEDLHLIKKGVINLIKLFSANSQLNIPLHLNGAGGGLASGIGLFYKSKLIPARDFIRNNILKDINLKKIDAVITGEGKFDSQSFEGKGIGTLLELFSKREIPIYIICGSAELESKIDLPKNIKVIELQDFFKNKKDSIKNFKSGISKAVLHIKNELKQ